MLVSRKHYCPRETMNTARGFSSPLTLKAGCGFETRGSRYHVDDFVIVDASMPAGLCAPLHLHERAYFTLVLRGGFEERYGSRTLNAAAGTINFVPSGTPHRTRSHGVRLVRMEFPDSVLALAGAFAPALQQPAVFTQSTLVSLARRVVAEVRSCDDGWRLVVQGLLMELLGHVVRNESSSPARRIPHWLRGVMERLNTDWSRPLSLGELASSADIHPMHLARAFRASYGCSVGEYRRGRQLRMAEERLLRSDADLCEVALSCGFANQSHFSKAFRREFGVSPGEYRRIHR
jgi:AraC family transcriptional regulator